MSSLSTLFFTFQNSILENLKQDQKEDPNEDPKSNHLDPTHQPKRYPILSEIVGDKRLSGEKRFEVYFNAYAWRLLDILADDYSKLCHLMGEERFYGMAKLYLIKHPSVFRNVRYFGQHLSSFLQNTDPYSKEPWLREMATLEWSMSHAIDALDATPITKESLSQIPIEEFGNIQLTFHPSLEIIDFYWDVPVLWKIIGSKAPENKTIEKNTAKNSTAENNAEEDNTTENNESSRPPTYQSTPTSWIIYREERQVIFRSLSKDETIAFKAMKQGSTFAEMCELLAERMDEETVPEFAIGCLLRWVEDKMVIDI